MLSINEVKHIAKLANFTLSEEELLKFQKQLSEIIDYFEILKKADTSLVPLKTHAYDFLDTNFQTLSQDHEKLTRSDALRNAKQKTEKYFVTEVVL